MGEGSPISERFDPRPVLAGLRDFQRLTVDAVFEALYGPRGARRFLVADEVGLGKTLVARGLIARAIEHLQREGVERVDVVYVCSNADIARQNINRLNVTGRNEYNLPTRLTLLPLHLHALKDHGLNFVSFTPGTAFDLKGGGGLAWERALLYRMLQHAWGRRGLGHVGVFHLLRGGAGLESFRKGVSEIPEEPGTTDGTMDAGLAAAFARDLAAADEAAHAAGAPGLQERFIELAERLRRARPGHPAWDARWPLIGELRALLARTCVRALEADIIILDEFQRFRDLLDGDSDAADLARRLFDESHDARVILLSATPYKMYTLADEHEEDHYRDFLRTARFLMGEEEVVRFAQDLRSFRHELLRADDGDPARVLRAKGRVQGRLRRVMVRTERLGVTEDRNGMLEDRALPGVRLAHADLRAWITADRVSRHLGAGDALEYWKSGSYLLNFMESYKLKRELRTMAAEPDGRARLAELLDGAEGLLPLEDIEAYRRIDPGNARLRGLMGDVLDDGSWRLLWMPPALPYYELGPPFDTPRLRDFTKRLVFSSWTVVPGVIAAMLSYEAERRMLKARGGRPRNTPEARRKLRPLLRFGRVDGRLTSMSLFGLLYPSPALARLGDPLEIGRLLGSATGLPSREDVLEEARRRIERALRPVVRGRPTDGPVDESWYWAAPLLLDEAHTPGLSASWLARRGAHEVWSSGSTDEAGDGSLWAEHVAEARALLADPGQLGRVPDDLPAILALMAVGGPASCALRAFARVGAGSRDFWETAARDGAARVAWGFRSAFNVPEVTAMLRGRTDAMPYWLRVVEYGVNGCLQAVMSEYAHVLRESLGLLSRDAVTVVPQMASVINEALSVRAANYSADDIQVEGGEMRMEPRKLRARYALRFGAQSLEDSAELQRAGLVRTAFNSPFWPFVLATTSVGQEGLDFHQYCHAVVHWNLPANPVDLEQREGRVHRYKGHAIRKNVAAAHRAAAFGRAVTDPWEAMFEAARRARSRSANDLVPYWIYPEDPVGSDGKPPPARIERYVPALPLSREVEKLEELKRSLAAYRLVFGQPRQEDLTAWLAWLERQGVALDVKALLLDLSPRPDRG